MPSIDWATHVAKIKAVRRALTSQAVEHVLDACCSCKSNSSPDLLIRGLCGSMLPQNDIGAGFSHRSGCKRGSATSPVRRSQSRPSGRGSPPGFAPGSICCSSGMLYPRNLMPSSGSSNEVSQSRPCTSCFVSIEMICKHRATQRGNVRAAPAQHGSGQEPLHTQYPVVRSWEETVHIPESGHAALCLFSNAGKRATVMPLMPPIVMSTVTFPSSLPPYCFLMAFNRSCILYCSTQIKW